MGSYNNYPFSTITVLGIAEEIQIFLALLFHKEIIVMKDING